MGAILLALGTRSVTPGLPSTAEAVVCFTAALAGTAAVGWWASRLEGARLQRERDALAAATPVGGIH